MTQMTKVNRRSFVVGSSALGAGLALGFHVPLARADAVAAPEVNAWVVVKPDETEKLVIALGRANIIDDSTAVTLLGRYRSSAAVATLEPIFFLNRQPAERGTRAPKALPM